MNNLSQISVVILTKNAEKRLPLLLSSVKDFAEVVIADDLSTDKTVDFAKRYLKVNTFSAPLQGFGAARNRAAAWAKNGWILMLDADELIPEDLAEEIASLKLDPCCIYSMPRKNFFRNRWIKGCGWYPDRVMRLYHRDSTCWSDDLVHEKLLVKNLSIVPLRNAIHHYSYETFSDFITKMQRYTDLFAEQNNGKKKGSYLKAISHGFFAFFKSYILQKGFLDNGEGFFISSYQAFTAFLKYLKLMETGL